MPIEIVFEGQLPNYRYQANIYLSKTAGQEVYRVSIGREGTECPPVKDLICWHEISDFMHGPEIQRWVQEQIRSLRAQGKTVQFDTENLSFIIDATLAELAGEPQDDTLQRMLPE